MPCNCQPPDANPNPTIEQPKFVFPLENFLAEFPEFDTDAFTRTQLSRIGFQAHRYITEWLPDFPLKDPDDRLYAVYLMAAHILILRKNASDDIGNGTVPSGGRVRKAVIGSVSVETESPNTYTSDAYSYWLSQTVYGQELQAYLDNACPAGIYMNTKRDSVRVL